MRTSFVLIGACSAGRYPSLSVFNDYSGSCYTKTDIDIVYDVYKDLIFQKGVEEKLLHNCFLSNRLNDLMHIKNIHVPSRSYVRFRMRSLDLTTHACVCPIPSEEWLQLLSDDHCPRCSSLGYITSEAKFDKVCYICCKWMCGWCVSEDEETCVRCS